MVGNVFGAVLFSVISVAEPIFTTTGLVVEYLTMAKEVSKKIGFYEGVGLIVNILSLVFFLVPAAAALVEMVAEV